MGNSRLDQPRGASGHVVSPWRRRAWIAVLLVPVAFVLAFPVGQGIYAALGYRPEDADVPGWAVLVASVLIVSVVLVPCVAAVYCGWRAIRDGDRGAVVPAVIGALAGVGVIALTVVNEAGNVVGR